MGLYKLIIIATRALIRLEFIKYQKDSQSNIHFDQTNNIGLLLHEVFETEIFNFGEASIVVLVVSAQPLPSFLHSATNLQQSPLFSVSRGSRFLHLCAIHHQRSLAVDS